MPHVLTYLNFWVKSTGIKNQCFCFWRLMKYCPHCNAIAELDHSHRIDNRGTRQQRGYSDEWVKFSKWYLKIVPLCVECRPKGLIRAAKDCHVPRYDGDVVTRHAKVIEIWKTRPEDLPKYVFPLCKDCHNVRTKRGE